MTISTFPARIHILLARDEPTAIVIRRGPSKQVCTLLWSRRDDTFTLAQWLKGRIYERRSDLSPDGQYFIYFAMNGKWSSETGGSWTAISRTPWLKAISLWGKGDCWHGGGLFTSNQTYWLNGSFSHRLMLNSSQVNQDNSFQPSENYGGECPGVYFHRLQRDGWQLINKQRSKDSSVTIFDKPLNKGWTLRKYAHAACYSTPGRGCYWDEHELINSSQSIVCHYSDWEWADWDRHRLVWAKQGYLYSGRLSQNGLQEEQVIYDFNPLKFEPIQAPY